MKDESKTTKKSPAKKSATKTSKAKTTKATSKSAEINPAEARLHAIIARIDDMPIIRKGKSKQSRPSDNIYFSLEDLDNYLKKRELNPVKASTSKPTKKAVVKQAPQPKPVVTPVVAREPLAVATMFDILGLNPVVAETHDKLEKRDVPRKWLKYYNLLIDLRAHHSTGVETRAEEVLKRSAKDDAGDLSSYGQHLGDAGSESFERDMAYNLMSNQKEILAEVEEAIKRIKNGTYGICEVTGEPIPESRLLSVPYTRCTKEGQEIKESEIKRQKASQRATIFDITGDVNSSTPQDDESNA